jgi:hypothetical protein
MMAPFHTRHLSFRQWQLVISPVWGLPIQHSSNALLSGTIPHPIRLASLKRFFPLTVNAFRNIYLNLPPPAYNYLPPPPPHLFTSLPPSHSCFTFPDTPSCTYLMQRPTCTDIRVRSVSDALIIFYAVSKGVLPIVSRRLDSEERRCIRSGSVYVWEERGPDAEATGVRL